MSRNSRGAWRQPPLPALPVLAGPSAFKVFVHKREEGATEDQACGDCWLKAGMSLENACGSLAGKASVRYVDHRSISLAALNPNETGTTCRRRWHQ